MNIGIIGTGTMGRGIAQTFIQYSDYNIIICGKSICNAKKAIEQIKETIIVRAKKGKITLNEANEFLSRITPKEITELKFCDVVIESIIEDLNAKHSLFSNLQNICNKDCIFVTNTSSLSITAL